MNIEDMEVSIFKALAHPIRIKVIKKLQKQQLCVCKLNEDLEFSQSNLSQHLKILRDAGILEAEKKGSWTHYRVKNSQILQVIDIVENMIIKDIKNMSDKLGE